MKILFLRHGKTKGNKENRYIGRTDEPLCAEGRTELKRRDTEFSPEIIYSSPMKRAVETAKICFPDAKICTEEGLKEMDFGVFESRLVSELEKDPLYKEWIDSYCSNNCHGGETLQDFNRRVYAGFEKLYAEAKKSGRNEIAIVAHGGVIMALFDRFSEDKRDFFDWFVKNGCGYTADVKDNGSISLLNIKEF